MLAAHHTEQHPPPPVGLEVTINVAERLRTVLRERALTPLFQPIVDLTTGAICGYEGLIRGPAGTTLHTPAALFEAARRSGMTLELERLCRGLHIETFLKLNLSGKLFLNMSPDALLLSADASATDGHESLDGHFEPGQVVVEITEADAMSSYSRLRQAACDLRASGLNIAIDDLGEGFSSLRLWSELRPDYIKIDRYFVQGIDRDSIKRQFVKSIYDIACHSGSSVIAEGIETPDELAAVRGLGIRYGQGYLLGRPAAMPPRSLPEPVFQLIESKEHERAPMNAAYRSVVTARKIMRTAPAVERSTVTNTVYEMFVAEPDLQTIVVVQDDRPCGLIHRARLLDRLARPYHHELYGNKPCEHFIDHEPLIVEHATSIQDLSYLITESDPQHLSDGFIVVEDGVYLGIGTGLDLIREITQLQIHAARYANPLTQLPGNVPISEHVQALLEEGAEFAVCHVDLDNFKPFNDLYGYSKGDDLIRITADLLRQHTNPSVDFVGHVGGDDFLVVFRSSDWRARCDAILAAFSPAIESLFSREHVRGGGYISQSRQGSEVFHPLVTLSLGVVMVPPHSANTQHQIAEAAAQAKSMAKKQAGNACFIERRAWEACPN